MWRIELSQGVSIRLGWLSALLCARRTVDVASSSITSVEVRPRGDLEPHLDNRVLGLGTSIGERWRGRTRVGRFLGRGVVGEQFWAVPAGDPETMPLVVVDCDPATAFARLVFYVDDADSAASHLRPAPG